MKNAYPSARVVVVEIEDWELGIELPGPVKRLLDAAADGYVTADSIEELADQLTFDRQGTDRVDDDTAPVPLPTASVDEVILATLSERITRERRITDRAVGTGLASKVRRRRRRCAGDVDCPAEGRLRNHVRC